MSKPPPKFGEFDRRAEVSFTKRNLPHWFQAGVAIFITFRTLDSMPREVIADWHHEIRAWLAQSDAPSSGELPVPNSLPKQLQSEYRRVRDRGWQQRLDECHGECVLKRPELAQIVASSLLHFDGDRYDLAAFVVMPNHVHVIVQFRLGFSLEQQSQSWLRFSATKINQHLGQRGAFWQAEPFDHLIRSEEQFWYLVEYIRDNPRRAGVKLSSVAYYNVFE